VVQLTERGQDDDADHHPGPAIGPELVDLQLLIEVEGQREGAGREAQPECQLEQLPARKHDSSSLALLASSAGLMQSAAARPRRQSKETPVT
jgi:hypothetical protein